MQVSPLSASLQKRTCSCSVCGLWPVWKKRSRPPLRSPVLLSTRVTCQLMWPGGDVSRSGKNQMFSFTSGASVLSFSRRRQANVSTYPDSLALHAQGSGSITPPKDINISDKLKQKKKKERKNGVICVSWHIPTPLKPENVLHYTSLLRFDPCWCCLMAPQSAGQQGVVVPLRLTSTRLFLAKDLLTARLTLWSAQERTAPPSPYKIPYWHDPFDGNRQKDGGYKTIMRRGLTSSQLMESSSSFGEAVGRVGLSITWFMIYFALHVFSQVSESYSQLEQRGLGVCFAEDKLKLDTFISAWCSWGAGDSLIKKWLSLITQLQMQEEVTVPVKWREKSKGAQNVYKAQP